MIRNVVLLAGTSSLWLVSTTTHAQLDLESATSTAGSTAGQVAGAGGDLRAEARLNQELGVSGVRSRIQNGVATLEGTVKTEAEKARAEQTARRVQGVTTVRNQVVVSADPASSAHAGDPLPVAADTAVRAKLKADARFAGREIDVRVNSRNVVTLTGEVASEAEKAIAGRIAAGTRAVTGVDYRLKFTSD
jgi:osmotically-inducible protein OsmY